MEISIFNACRLATRSNCKRKALNPIMYETPYKNTTGRGPAVKAAVQPDKPKKIPGENPRGNKGITNSTY